MHRLDKVFERHCTRKDFAVVHIIRDVRGLAAAWKADQHLVVWKEKWEKINGKMVVWKKAHGNHPSFAEIHRSDEYDEATCPEGIQREVQSQLDDLAVLYAQDLAAVAKFKENKECNMAYVQVDGDTYANNPLGE